MQKRLPSWLVSLAVLAPIPAPRAQAPAPIATATAADLRTVLVDETPDGAIVVLAPGYKAHFSRAGVEYIPYFGSKAPRNFPLRFTLRSVHAGPQHLALALDTPPVHTPDRITFARGHGLTEVWHLRLHEVEQTFEFAAGTNPAITVRLDVVTDLPCTDTADGLSFGAGPLGEVRYGDLTAVAANGQRATTPSRWMGDGIELAVPATFAATARGAITLDPVIRAIAIDTGADDNILPDVAYEPNSDRWLVVYERVFSILDHDIIARRYSGIGNFIEEVAVATGSRESKRPAVAANSASNQFLVVWDEDVSLLRREIKGRMRTPSSTAQGPTFTVRGATGDDHMRPDIGGGTELTASNVAFVVVFEDHSTRDTAILATRVEASTQQQLSVVLAGNSPATYPRVSKVRGPGSEGWLCAFGLPNQVIAAFLRPVNGSTLLANIDSGTDFGPPDVAGSNAGFLIVYAAKQANGLGDVIGARVRIDAGPFMRLLGKNDLTAAEPNGIVNADQQEPVVSWDGCRFTYAYLEHVPAVGSFDAFAATLVPGAQPQFSDSRRALHTATRVPEQHLALASKGEIGGDAGIYFAAWEQEVSGSDHDILGALYHGTTNTGGVQVVGTRCGTFLVNIVAENTPALGARFRVRTDPIQPQNQLHVVGLPTTPIPICPQGCRLGAFPILLNVPGNVLELPIPCDLNILGASLAVQNVHLTGPGGCTTASLPIPLTVTDTLVLTVH